MLYYLFKYLHAIFQWPGTGLFKYISFRAAMATLSSFTIIFLLGQAFINYLSKKQVVESSRALGFTESKQKVNTPTMGGILIILATVLPTLLFSKLHNIYIILLLITTIWMGLVGFLDDYIKVFKKKNVD